MTRLHNYYIIGLLAVLVSLNGCGSMAPNTVTLKDDGKNPSGQVDVSKAETVIAIDPVAFAGIPYSDALRQGNFISLLARFPESETALAEYDAYRVSYPCYAVDGSGRTYPAHALFAGYVGMRLSAAVIVEGLNTPRGDLRIIWLSTRVRSAYTLTGLDAPEPFDGKRFRNSAEYRKEFTQRNGTSATALRPISDMDKAIATWTVYETKSGTIVSPLAIEQVRYLAGLNPMYSFGEKFIGTAQGGISVSFNPTKDLIANATQLAFNAARAAGTKPMGFDYESNLSRMDAGRNLKVFSALMEQQNARLTIKKQGGQ